MPATSFAPAHFGFQSQVVAVECDLTSGLPAMIVVGLGDKAVDEARERIRSAIRNSGLIMLPKRYTLNLAPADLPKDGTVYDLAMAISILAASGQIACSLENSLFLGELALDGTLRAVRGVIAAGQLAAQAGISHVFLPAANAAEAAMIEGITTYPAQSLLDVFLHLNGNHLLAPYTPAAQKAIPALPVIDFADILGQQSAKRALEIAASGGHNVLLSGSPGAGKTLLAKATAGILPPPSHDEQLEIAKLYSLAGMVSPPSRPFRSPHHTASGIALAGGGRIPKPGEISLAHHGVLFLDELPEFGNTVLEVLRQPLEDGHITISRAQGSVVYPARFMLIAAQNPCPCGYHGDPVRECSCSPGRINSYRQRISGPLLDRFDMLLHVAPLPAGELLSAAKAEPTSSIARRVIEARRRQTSRSAIHSNAEMGPADIARYCRLDADSRTLARSAITGLKLSARLYQRSLKVARTIADLEGSKTILTSHLAEAFGYRSSS